MSSSQPDCRTPEAKPPWLRVKAPGSPDFQSTKDLVERLGLNTVCREAMCPNIGECWAARTATFLILGNYCTRACRFCAVKKSGSAHIPPPDSREPERVARAVKELGLKHAVITSVTRDDLKDYGAAHFAATVRSIKSYSPACKVELLIPDFKGCRESLETVIASGVDLLNHNLETVPGLYAQVRPGADYLRSLSLLRQAKEILPELITKSGIMVGLGETKEEVWALMDDLRGSCVDIMTIGQYLRPSAAQTPVVRYVAPEEFAEHESVGLAKGFWFVESAPLVRSSYHAWKHSAAPLRTGFKRSV